MCWNHKIYSIYVSVVSIFRKLTVLYLDFVVSTKNFNHLQEIFCEIAPGFPLMDSRLCHCSSGSDGRGRQTCNLSCNDQRGNPGPCFNIKMSSYQYRKSHCGDKTVVRSSYLHNGISYTGKMSLYWIRAQDLLYSYSTPAQLCTKFMLCFVCDLLLVSLICMPHSGLLQ